MWMGIPKHSGCRCSSRCRTPQNSTMASRKPRPAPTAFTIDSSKVQLPADVEHGDAQHGAVGGDQRQIDTQGFMQGGDILFQDDLHQLYTRAAMTRMNTTVWR